MNKAIIMGNVSRTDELRATANGTPVHNFSIATNRTYRVRDGERKETVEFHNIVAFGTLAEATADFKVGDHVSVEGRINTRKDDKDRYRTEIVIESFQRI